MNAFGFFPANLTGMYGPNSINDKVMADFTYAVMEVYKFLLFLIWLYLCFQARYQNDLKIYPPFSW